jgi:hypothetical protein
MINVIPPCGYINGACIAGVGDERRKYEAE